MTNKPTYEQLEKRVQELEQAGLKNKEYVEELKKYQNIVSSTPDGIAFLDKTYRYIIVNDAYEGASGFDRGHFLGLTVSEYLGKEVFEQFIKPNFDRCLQGEIVNYQEWFNYPTLGKRFVDVTYLPYRDDCNRIAGVIANTRDITEHKRAEEVLRDEAIRRRILVEQSRDGIVVVDQNGKVHEANQQYANMLGYSMEELHQLHVWDWDTQWTQEQLLEMILAVDDTGAHFETRHRRKDGTLYDVEISTNGQKLVFCVCRDITERKKAERALQESERLLNRVGDIAKIGGWEMDLEKGGKATWTKGTYDIVEIEPDEPIPGANEHVDWYLPEYREMIKKKMQNLVETRQPMRFEAMLKTKRGNLKWCQAIGEVVERDGKIVKLRGTFQDITERKQAEEEVQESEAFLNAILNSIADPICIKDEKHRWALVNDKFCEISGISRQGLLGKSDYDYFPKAEADVFWKMDEGVLETGKENFSEETLTNAASGRTIFLHTKKSLYESAKGAKFIVAIGRDVTEQKMAEERLRHAQKIEAIGTLAGGIAHDFNNILAAMIGYAEMAMDSTSDQPTVQTDLHEVLKAGVRARELVHQILTFSRQTEQETKPVKVKLVVREATRLLRASIPRTIEMVPSMLSDSSVMADPTQIHQVVINLCANAAHAMEEKGGVLEVSLEDVLLDADFVAQHPDVSSGLYVRLIVSDTGHGMDPSTVSRIFEPYFSTKEKGEGTGLGLSVVHGIVKSHGGAITVYSEPGEGSTFHVYLPVVEQDAPAEITAEGVLPTGSETILLVDDELSLVNLGKQMLEGLGYGVVTRTSSLEALEVFRNQPSRFDLVVTDMTMPTMTGDQLATELMKIRPDIPVILCTGFSRKISEPEAKAIGIRAFVMKPFLKRDIATTVREVLDEK